MGDSLEPGVGGSTGMINSLNFFTTQVHEMIELISSSGPHDFEMARFIGQDTTFTQKQDAVRVAAKRGREEENDELKRKLKQQRKELEAKKKEETRQTKALHKKQVAQLREAAHKALVGKTGKMRKQLVKQQRHDMAALKEKIAKERHDLIVHKKQETIDFKEMCKKSLHDLYAEHDRIKVELKKVQGYARRALVREQAQEVAARKAREKKEEDEEKAQNEEKKNQEALERERRKKDKAQNEERRKNNKTLEEEKGKKEKALEEERWEREKAEHLMDQGKHTRDLSIEARSEAVQAVDQSTQAIDALTTIETTSNAETTDQDLDVLDDLAPFDAYIDAVTPTIDTEDEVEPTSLPSIILPHTEDLSDIDFLLLTNLTLFPASAPDTIPSAAFFYDNGTLAGNLTSIPHITETGAIVGDITLPIPGADPVQGTLIYVALSADDEVRTTFQGLVQEIQSVRTVPGGVGNADIMMLGTEVFNMTSWGGRLMGLLN